MRKWLDENGAALEAEKDAERARLQPIRVAKRAKANQRRRAGTTDAVAVGRISALDAGFQTLLASDYRDPQARRLAILAWLAQNGDALKAERRTGKTMHR